MNCPVCGGKTAVVDCHADCEAVYRRRKCLECDYRFYSTEEESDGKAFRSADREYRRKYQRKRRNAQK